MTRILPSSFSIVTLADEYIIVKELFVLDSSTSKNLSSSRMVLSFIEMFTQCLSSGDCQDTIVSFVREIKSFGDVAEKKKKKKSRPCIIKPNKPEWFMVESFMVVFSCNISIPSVTVAHSSILPSFSLTLYEQQFCKLISNTSISNNISKPSYTSE